MNHSNIIFAKEKLDFYFKKLRMQSQFLTLLHIIISFVCFNFIVNAQTNPAPQSLPYSQDFSAVAHASSTYPIGWQGWQLATSGSPSFRTIAPTGDRTLTASSTASINSGNLHNYNGKIGFLNSASLDLSLVVAINTSGFTDVQITYDIMTIRNPYDGGSNTRINEFTLQYRVGTTGTFTNLTSILYQNNTTTQTGSVTTPQKSETKMVTLPMSCNDQPVVQLRWVSREVSGVGSRPSIAIDNFNAVGTEIELPCDLMFTLQSSTPSACDDNTGSITLTSTATYPGQITYSISGPVSANNMTGMFTGIPSGIYTVEAYIDEECSIENQIIVNLVPDVTNPTASDPEPSAYNCLQDVPVPNIEVVTDEDDDCPTCIEMVWINEVHYDNSGDDVSEFIEVAGVAGTNLTGYTLELFNGSNPSSALRYSTLSLTGIIPNQSNGLGTISFPYPSNGIQNGPNDGIALVKNGTTVVQLISYEGPMTVAAGQGAASGMTALPINVSEDSSTPVGFSLQLNGSGNKYQNFTWVTPSAESPGSINTGQIFTPCDNTMVTYIGQTIIPSSGDFDDPTIIERTYEIKDAAGNKINVTHTISVSSVICGWSSDDNGVNCNNGTSVSYNENTQTFALRSTNCYYPNPFTSDQLAFAQTTICGNGSITAQVTSITPLGLGWAGVTMRENNDAGAKKAQLMTNLSAFSRREFRTTTGGAAYPQQFPSQNRYWLRITRTGNQFDMYVSPNGTNWFFAGSQVIVMNNCIEAGLVVTNYNPNSTITATFANVNVSGSGPVPTKPSFTPQNDVLAAADFKISPNPTYGHTEIDLSAYTKNNVQIDIISLQGKLLRSTQVEAGRNREEVDLSGLTNGMYLIRLIAEGLPDVTKRLVISRTP